MTGTEPDARDLRRALADAAETGRRAPRCPARESFWDAQRGSLSPARTRELVEHTVVCPSCAEAWRVAHAMGAMEEKAGSRPASARWSVAAAAAAVLLVAAGLVFLVPPGGRDTDVRYRAGRGVAIESATPEDDALARDAFVLRWAPAADGTVYRAELTTESFESIASVEGLDRPEWRVPERALAGVDSGTRLYWRVEALLPGGRIVRSETFVVTMQ